MVTPVSTPSESTENKETHAVGTTEDIQDQSAECKTCELIGQMIELVNEIQLLRERHFPSMGDLESEIQLLEKEQINLMSEIEYRPGL